MAPKSLVDSIVQGDCLETLRKVPANSIHLAITSPPYNVGKKYANHDDSMDYPEYLKWLSKVWNETKRVLIPGGRFALNIAPTGIANFTPVHHDVANQLRAIGLIFRTEIIWYKQTIYKRTAWGSWRSPRNPHILPSWEYVYIFSKDMWTLEGTKAERDIEGKEFQDFSDGHWYIPPETRRNGHPAPFPEELIYRLIKFYTFRDNIVLDMFGGTGTVAVVARRSGRRFLHIDISKEYCRTAQLRLNLVNRRRLKSRSRYLSKLPTKS